MELVVVRSLGVRSTLGGLGEDARVDIRLMWTWGPFCSLTPLDIREAKNQEKSKQE